MADREIAGMRCSDVLEAAGAFVLGALPREEAEAIRRHLAECPDSHAEVAELGGAAVALLATVEPAVPPADLKARILAAAAAAETPPALTPPLALPSQVQLDSDRTAKPYPVTPKARRGFDLGALLGRPVWAGVAAVAVLAAIALGAWNLQLRDELDGLSAYRAGVVAVLEEAARPGAQVALLTDPDDPAGPSGLASVGADGSVALVMRDLPPTSGSQVYETWLIGADSNPVPIGSFTVDASRTASFATARAPIGQGVTVALTLEPSAGATMPTLPIVVLGTARSGAS